MQADGSFQTEQLQMSSKIPRRTVRLPVIVFLIITNVITKLEFLMNKKSRSQIGPAFFSYMESVRDLQDSLSCLLSEQRESPGIPSDRYLQGLSVRR